MVERRDEEKSFSVVSSNKKNSLRYYCNYYSKHYCWIMRNYDKLQETEEKQAYFTGEI
jgi:hypothetical protein